MEKLGFHVEKKYIKLTRRFRILKKAF